MTIELKENHNKNNFAYEIRFVDNKKVQVFDLAAKRVQDSTLNTILPLEYNEDEVIHGELRYSKLMGSEPSAAKDLFGYEETDKPYEHHVVTKFSKDSKSAQRTTFFMMGGGGGGGSGGNGSSGRTYSPFDSGTDLTQESIQNDKKSKDDNLTDIAMLHTIPNKVNEQVPRPSTDDTLPTLNIPKKEDRIDMDSPKLSKIEQNHQNKLNQTLSKSIQDSIGMPPQVFIPTQPYSELTIAQSYHESIDILDLNSLKPMQQSLNEKNHGRKSCCIIS